MLQFELEVIIFKFRPSWLQIKVFFATSLLFASYQLWVYKNKEQKLKRVAAEAQKRQSAMEENRRKLRYEEYKLKNKDRKIRWKEERERLLAEKRLNAPQLSAAQPRGAVEKPGLKFLQKIAKRIFSQNYKEIDIQEPSSELSFDEVKVFNGYSVHRDVESRMFPVAIEYAKPANEPVSVLFFSDLMGEALSWELDSSDPSVQAFYSEPKGKQLYLDNKRIYVHFTFHQKVYVENVLTEIVLGNVFLKPEVAVDLVKENGDDVERGVASVEPSLQSIKKIGHFIGFDEKNNWTESQKKTIQKMSKQILLPETLSPSK